MSELLRTPLYELHVSNGGKMVPFAGYEMPVQYQDGVLKEHLHCRKKAGLFDVSHMGQVIIKGKSVADVAQGLEALIPISISNLKEGRQRYGFFTNALGGIIDDLMLSNRGDYFFMVVNAACKHIDILHMIENMANVAVELIEDRALLALQGPMAETILANFNIDIKEMRFMDISTINILGVDCWVARSGYTGEDGFEISIPADEAIKFVEKLLKFEEVKLIGLGARDSLRLEAGLCLYGHDIDCDTSPVEAGLSWAIQGSRREGGTKEWTR